MKELFDFQKVYLESGASVKLFFAATESDLSLVNIQVCFSFTVNVYIDSNWFARWQGVRELCAGQYVIHIGDLEDRIEVLA